MKSRQLLSAVATATVMFAGGAANASGVLTFDPQHTNTGCTNIAAGACGAVGTTGAYSLDNSIINYVGVLDITNGPGVIPTASTWFESGNILIENFKLANAVQTSGVWRANGGEYDIYAKYTADGSGFWLSSTNFTANIINNLKVTLYASPLGGTTQVLGDPTSGVDATGGVVSNGSKDFILGVANIIAGPNTASAAIASNGTASTSLTALLDFTPAAGVTGLDGFLFKPDPFYITIGAQAGGNPNNTTWAANGAGVRISTLNSNRGGGSLAFTALQVPEPGALALVGIALAGLGWSERRRATKS